MRLTLDERVKLQMLLTAAGYWPAVPDADFSTRLFNAILQFEVDNGFAPLGVLTDEQMDRLMAIAGPYLNTWRFQLVRHPMTNSQIWVPIGLPLTEELTATGLTFFNRPFGVVLTYDYYPEFTLRAFVRVAAQQTASAAARRFTIPSSTGTNSLSFPIPTESPTAMSAITRPDEAVSASRSPGAMPRPTPISNASRP